MMKSIKIGNIRIDVPIALGPMAGVTDRTFRLICREAGAELLYTEMVSAKAIVYHNRNTYELMKTGKDESPAALQLFGSDPDSIAAATEQTKEMPCDILDLNCGCPVPKVVKNNEGSALMKDPQLAERIFKAMVKASDRPVTIKMRSGFDDGHINAPEIARIAQDCGVSMVAVHARTREQFYSGKADWSVIRRVKEAVSIPVFGNGDIKDGPSAKAMLEETGCDGIMIGRAALGDPWIFSRVRHYLETGEELPRPSSEVVFEMVKRHARSLVEDKGEYIGIRQMRAHASWYITGMPHAASMRRRINEAESLEEFEEMINGYSEILSNGTSE